MVLAANLMPDGTHGRSTNLLLLLPEQKGKFCCLAGDVKILDGAPSKSRNIRTSRFAPS